jgi:DNA-binding beta-propeller fold protein YncE
MKPIAPHPTTHPRRSGTRALAVTCLATAAAWLAMAGTALAAPGDIAYDGCLADDASQGCFDIPFEPLNDAHAVAVSPDGKSVYVASSHVGSIAHFFRGGPDGQISYDGCVADQGVSGCANLPASPLKGASDVAVSPDGASIYVVSPIEDSISHFRRTGPDGQISYAGCVNNTGNHLCAKTPGDGNALAGARGVAVSPDGRSLYVASERGDSVAHLFRNTVTGQLTWDGCLNDTGADNCFDVPGDKALDGARGVAVSPDGKSVYVTSATANAVAHLFRDPLGGQISWDGCLNNDGSNNCFDVPGDKALQGASSVAVSPDGKSVYVTAADADSIAHLFRSTAGGQISWDGCLNNDGSQNCGTLPGAPLAGAVDVAVSPDGRSVYVTSLISDSISHFRRTGPDGQITYDRCLGNTGSTGCSNVPFAPLDAAGAVAVSPDGRSVYVASRISNSVSHFFRELEPPVTEPTPKTSDPTPTGDTVAPIISELTLTNRRFRARGRRSGSRVPVGTTFRYRLSEAATVRVAIERARPGRRSGGRCAKPTRRLRRRPACTRFVSAGPALVRAAAAGANTLRFDGRRLPAGAYRARFTATDASGNRSRASVLRFRIATPKGVIR